MESADPNAKLALDLYAYRIGRELDSLAAALGGLDATANAKGGPRLTTAQSRAAAWIIPTNKELMIARHTTRLLRGTR